MQAGFTRFSTLNSLKLTLAFQCQSINLNLDIQILVFHLTVLWQSISVTAFLPSVFRRYFAQNHCYLQVNLFLKFEKFSIIDEMFGKVLITPLCFSKIMKRFFFLFRRNISRNVLKKKISQILLPIQWHPMSSIWKDQHIY